MRSRLRKPLRHASWLFAVLLIAGPRLPRVWADHASDRHQTFLRAVKKLERDQLMEGARERDERMRRHARQLTTRGRHPGRRATAKSLRGARQRPAFPPDERDGFHPRSVARFGPARINRTTVLTNVPLNDPAMDGPNSNAGQSEPYMASLGNFVVAMWNDGGGFQFTPSHSVLGYGYSVDGGATFTDGGELPAPAGSQWSSDPIVSVNEKTGEFYGCGLLDIPDLDSATSNGLGFLRGRFTGNTFSWDTPVIVRSAPNTQHFFDKPWMVADSVSGNIYLTYTDFYGAGLDAIEFQRSLNRGSTWSAFLALSSAAATGLVQGSRVVVGPSGELYGVWKEIGTGIPDFMRIRKSVDFGQTFQAEETVSQLYDNFGTGAPGFNRERGITFPSIAVDRSIGPHRGRVYITWNESLNWLGTNVGDAGTQNETENNDFFSRANSFIPGQTVTGTFANPGTADIFRFSAVQGVSYIFFCDSVPQAHYSMRVICADTTTRLTFSGDVDLSSAGGSKSVAVWTAPATDTYYLRMFYANGSGGFWRVLTGTDVPLDEPGRDQRDVVITSSDDGINWTPRTRVNDDPIGFDNWFPEVAVTDSGRVFTLWYDWRDAPTTCAGSSHVYLARSNDAGGSWVSLGAITSTQTWWTGVNSNIIPNQGDYLSLVATDRAVYSTWTDGRYGNPDIFMAVLPVAADTIPTITVTGLSVTRDSVAITWHISGTTGRDAAVYRGVGGGAFDSVAAVQSNGQGNASYVDRAVTAGVTYNYRLGIRIGGTQYFGGLAVASIPGGNPLALAGSWPNPFHTSGKIVYEVPFPGGIVEIAVHDLTGRKVRTLFRGPRTPGHHEDVTWNARDSNDDVVSAGIYFIRLSFGGQKLTKRVVVMPHER